MTNRPTCYHWRDGACRFENSCRNAHFRPAWTLDDAPPPTTTQPARSSEPADASQSQWPPLSSQGGTSQASPSQWPAPSQPTGNTAPPVTAQQSLRGRAKGSRSSDRAEWGTVVVWVLPFILPQERSGTCKEQVAGMKDGYSLVATCHTDPPAPRQVPAANPTGTCTPSASIRSMMATA